MKQTPPVELLLLPAPPSLSMASFNWRLPERERETGAPFYFFFFFLHSVFEEKKHARRKFIHFSLPLGSFDKTIHDLTRLDSTCKGAEKERERWAAALLNLFWLCHQSLLTTHCYSLPPPFLELDRWCARAAATTALQGPFSRRLRAFIFLKKKKKCTVNWERKKGTQNHKKKKKKKKREEMRGGISKEGGGREIMLMTLLALISNQFWKEKRTCQSSEGGGLYSNWWQLRARPPPLPPLPGTLHTAQSSVDVTLLVRQIISRHSSAGVACASQCTRSARGVWMQGGEEKKRR